MEGLIWYVHFIIRKRKVGGGRTFKIRGAELWNRIPLDMRKKDTAGQFKNALKKYFLPGSYGSKKDTAGQFKNALKNIFNLVLMGIMSSHF